MRNAQKRHVACDVTGSLIDVLKILAHDVGIVRAGVCAQDTKEIV
jgi:hypothetical protein